MIETKDLYANPVDCCGCEACSQSCPKGIIDMVQAYDGFYYPKAINPSQCIDCKRCLKVCPLKSGYSGGTAPSNYGGYSNDESDIKKSASGGLATVLSRQFIENGGIVYGVAYSVDFNSAEYKRCDRIDQLEDLRGSKYIQARKTRVYEAIKSDLNNKKRVLYIGLPCDVHALKILFPNNPNLFTVALICHGPTSPLVQKEFVSSLKTVNSGGITNFTVRGKVGGWKPYYIKARFDDGMTFEEQFLSSTYGIAFAELKRPSCSKCRFKLHMKHSTIDADLIIGDFHGAAPRSPYYNKWGVSQMSILTAQGEELKTMIKDEFTLVPISLYTAIHYNKALGRIIKPRWNRNQFAKTLSKYGLSKACKLQSIKLIEVYIKIVGKSKRLLANVKRRLLN